MSTDSSITRRAPGELEAAMDLAARCFGRTDAARLLERECKVAVLDRWLVARSSGLEIGQVGVHPLRLSVPGGRIVSAAGVTWVGVLPAAAGHGVMHRLMRAAHVEARASGEAISVLVAAQPRMYQRLGYGMAAREVDLLIPPAEIGNADARVLVNECDAREVVADLTHVTGQLAMVVPGVPVVGANWASCRLDPLPGRDGRGPVRAAVATVGDVVSGVALWCAPLRADETAVVHELLAMDGDSSTALIHHVREAAAPASAIKVHVGPGDPLIAAMPNPRAVVTSVNDRLYVRVLDVRAAMEGRMATADVDAVMEIAALHEDDEPNAQCWRLQATAGGDFTVTPSKQQPHVRMTHDALGALYLGDALLGDLVRAGRAQSDGSSAARTLGWAMRGEVSPWTPVAF